MGVASGPRTTLLQVVPVKILGPAGKSINPRPGGGLGHLRHGRVGAKMTPPLTRKLGKLEGRAVRRSTALSEPIFFGHFFAQVNIEVTRGHQRYRFSKNDGFIRNAGPYLGNYNSYAK